MQAATPLQKKLKHCAAKAEDPIQPSQRGQNDAFERGGGFTLANPVINSCG